MREGDGERILQRGRSEVEDREAGPSGGKKEHDGARDNLETTESGMRIRWHVGEEGEGQRAKSARERERERTESVPRLSFHLDWRGFP